MQITFGSIFNIYHGAPMLCYTITDLAIFLCKKGNFWYYSWDFDVVFVRALITYGYTILAVEARIGTMLLDVLFSAKFGSFLFG